MLFKAGPQNKKSRTWTRYTFYGFMAKMDGSRDTWSHQVFTGWNTAPPPTRGHHNSIKLGSVIGGLGLEVEGSHVKMRADAVPHVTDRVAKIRAQRTLRAEDVRREEIEAGEI